MRKMLSVLILALFLVCGFSAQAEDDIIYPQPVRITVEETGDYRLSFEGELDGYERWAWFACPDEDSAEDLMEIMRDAIAEKTPARGLTFDNVFQTWTTHGTSSIPVVTVPADSGYVFYGKAYCGTPSFDREQQLFMISLGGTNLSKVKPGEIGGNDLMDGGSADDGFIPSETRSSDLADTAVIPPKTGDPANPFLLALLFAGSFLGIVLLIKRSGKNRAA